MPGHARMYVPLLARMNVPLLGRNDPAPLCIVEREKLDINGHNVTLCHARRNKAQEIRDEETERERQRACSDDTASPRRRASRVRISVCVQTNHS